MAKYELTGKTVVMTGASGGIGSEAAAAFGRRGARLVLSGRNREALMRAAEKARAAGAEAHVVAADVTRREEVEALAQKALELTGAIDVMMLGAGYGVLGSVENVTPEQWRMQMEVNFFGALHGFYAALPHFLKQGHGRYIIMNSLSGRMAMGLSAPYCASKFALWGFTDSVRCELRAKNIRLLAVYPYFVKTAFQGNIRSPDFKVPADLAARMFGQSPTRLAERIVRACETGREEMLCTALGKIGVRAVPISYHASEWFRRRLLPFTRKILRAR